MQHGPQEIGDALDHRVAGFEVRGVPDHIRDTTAESLEDDEPAALPDVA